MDDNTRAFGQAERAKAMKARDEAQFIIDYWNRILGTTNEDTQDQAEVGNVAPSGGAGSDAPAASFVAHAELVGMTAPKAVKMVMTRIKQRTGMNRPLRVAEIHSLLAKGGISYKKDQLYTTLMRSPLFVSPQKGFWGLAEWYPKMAKEDSGRGETPTTTAPEHEYLMTFESDVPDHDNDGSAERGVAVA
jgi:hypothetical protein